MSSSEASPLSPALVALLAASCGLIVANVYFSQPLIGLIAPDLGLAKAAASLIVTCTQLGFCVGLVCLVPLGDLVENRRLVTSTVGVCALALALAAAAPTATPFLAACLLVGLTSVAVQMIVPIAAHFAPEAIRGRVVGNVMSGLLTGIMLARPVAGLVAGSFGWRTLFGASACVMVGLAAVLQRRLPQRRPVADHGYGWLIASLWQLLRDSPALRRRAAYQAAMFGAFSLYWTAVPLVLMSPRFGLGAHGVAWFSLAGAAGAVSAPLAGRLADRGHTRAATGAAMAMVLAAFGLGAWGGARQSVALLLAAAVLLDLGVQANMVLGQRVIYGLAAAVRSRLNALYMVIFFLGGAAGSAIASVAFERGGWGAVSAVGAVFPLAALLFYATEPRPRAAASALAASASPGDLR